MNTQRCVTMRYPMFDVNPSADCDVNLMRLSSKLSATQSNCAHKVARLFAPATPTHKDMQMM